MVKFKDFHISHYEVESLNADPRSYLYNGKLKMFLKTLLIPFLVAHRKPN